MSKPAVPLVIALWQTIIFINIHEYIINNLLSDAKNKISTSILADIEKYTLKRFKLTW